MKKKKICFDGFSKEDFITTSKYGVKSRHSNFSWFDPVWDQIFIKLIKNKKDKLLKEMVKIESSIKNAIILTGYAGYKYLMKIVNFTSLQGHVKMPGCNLNISQKKNPIKSF